VIYLNTGAIIKLTGANVTFQNIQFIELNLARTTGSPLFQPASNSILTFQVKTCLFLRSLILSFKNVIVRDIIPTASYYIFCRASTKSLVYITNSEFKNLTNVEIVLSASPLIATGNSFTDLRALSVPFVLLGSYTVTNGIGLTFRNNTFKYD